MLPLAFASPFMLLALAALPALWILLRLVPPRPRRYRFSAAAPPPRPSPDRGDARPHALVADRCSGSASPRWSSSMLAGPVWSPSAAEGTGARPAPPPRRQWLGLGARLAASRPRRRGPYRRRRDGRATGRPRSRPRARPATSRSARPPRRATASRAMRREPWTPAARHPPRRPSPPSLRPSPPPRSSGSPTASAAATRPAFLAGLAGPLGERKVDDRRGRRARRRWPSPAPRTRPAR